MKIILAAAIAALIALACPVFALSELAEEKKLYHGLACDTPDQVRQFLDLVKGGGNADRALLLVNVVAEKRDACVIGYYYGTREAVEDRVPQNGQVLGIIRMRIHAPAAATAVTWFSIELLPETDL